MSYIYHSPKQILVDVFVPELSTCITWNYLFNTHLFSKHLERVCLPRALNKYEGAASTNTAAPRTCIRIEIHQATERGGNNLKGGMDVRLRTRIEMFQAAERGGDTFPGGMDFRLQTLCPESGHDCLIVFQIAATTNTAPAMLKVYHFSKNS